MPGYAASHGCIRLPREFAARLWPTTKMGVRVVIARGEVAPVEFKHAALFVPTPKPAEPKVAVTEPAKPMRFAEAATTANDAAAALPDAVAAKPAATATDDAKPAAPVADAPKPADLAAAHRREQAGRGRQDRADPGGRAAAADETVTSTGAIIPMPAETPAPALSNELRKAVEAPQPAPTAPAVSPAPTPAAAPAGNDPEKPAPSLIDPAKPTAPRTKSADQPPKRNGQVAVFVSRKEKKIFVRQGFIPIFEMPITIANPDQPLGTHVFTAMALTDGGAGMRWNLITMPTSGLPPVQKSRKRHRRQEEAGQGAAGGRRYPAAVERRRRT